MALVGEVEMTCNMCDDTGRLFYIKVEKEIPHDYVAKCICEKGEKFKSYPSINMVAPEFKEER